jgi:hypothetical protein
VPRRLRTDWPPRWRPGCCGPLGLRQDGFHSAAPGFRGGGHPDGAAARPGDASLAAAGEGAFRTREVDEVLRSPPSWFVCEGTTETQRAKKIVRGCPVRDEVPFRRVKERFEELLRRLGAIHDVEKAAGVLSWDEETKMPPSGAEARAEQRATLNRIAHELQVSPDLAELLEELRPFGEEHDYDSFEDALSATRYPSAA